MNSKIVKFCFILVTTSQLVTVNLRNQGCGMLILVDDTVSIKLFQNNETVIRNKVDTYISKLNEIYQRTILKDPPNNNIYFFTEHLTLLRNYLPNCQNKGVLLSSISRVGGTADYCLVHLLLDRDIGCVEGLGNLNGLCKRHSNFAWSKVHPDNDEQTVNTIAHEVGHNFGSDHDGGNSSTYSGCSTKETMGILGGLMSKNFSTCSLSAMHWRLQQVLKAEPETHCFSSNRPRNYLVSERNMSEVKVSCPSDPDPDCPENQPDPPQAPEPPEPVCGDKRVDEPGEECDCGQDWAHCDDACCYPANITPADLAYNSSALPCTRKSGPLCAATPVNTYPVSERNMSEDQPDPPATPVKTYPVSERNMSNHQPDPQQAPESPKSVCGDKKVDEPGEECDCGQDWAHCDDACCYPANITPADLAYNSSALPCTRNSAPLCSATPVKMFLKFGLLYPFIFILIITVILALALTIDWRWGRRMMFKHITEKTADQLHIENKYQRERRLRRENESFTSNSGDNLNKNLLANHVERLQMERTAN